MCSLSWGVGIPNAGRNARSELTKGSRGAMLPLIDQDPQLRVVCPSGKQEFVRKYALRAAFVVTILTCAVNLLAGLALATNHFQ
jgi:hypothetical protein